eukprot:gnl/Dysnectes_brevis/5588_a8105_285.p1 GENE.gnl/Dysnectes_brevis/5588_a8105_285~~gnl/Dysnectes_brevis/5588_a8105_285.p1  ORF type:complete len:408 (+),score=78.10 gnl/Dysnectes_brevis/5588_a8105_285:125-1348(+)
MHHQHIESYLLVQTPSPPNDDIRSYELVSAPHPPHLSQNVQYFPQIRISETRTCDFDCILPDRSPSQIYEVVAQKRISDLVKYGTDASIISYGHNDTLRRSVMLNSWRFPISHEAPLAPISRDTPLIQRSIHDLFAQLDAKRAAHPGTEYRVHLSATAVNMERIEDGLLPAQARRERDRAYREEHGESPWHSYRIRERPGPPRSLYVPGLSVRRVLSYREAMGAVCEAVTNERVEDTFMGRLSSMRTWIFELHVEQRDPLPPYPSGHVEGAEGGTVVEGSLRLVILQSSRMQRRSGAPLRWAAAARSPIINLGHCVRALQPPAPGAGAARRVHVPYRSSKVTRLLQGDLCGERSTAFVGGVLDPLPADAPAGEADEGIGTMRLLDKVRRIPRRARPPVRSGDFRVFE